MTSGTERVIGRVADDRNGSAGRPAHVPQPRTAADAYRVSDDELRRARLVVAHNSGDPDELRELLDMLGLLSANPDQPPPVVR